MVPLFKIMALSLNFELKKKSAGALLMAAMFCLAVSLGWSQEKTEAQKESSQPAASETAQQNETPPALVSTKSEKTLIKPPSSSSEDSQRGSIVKEIVIEYIGPRSVAREVILSNMRTTVGQPYSATAVEEDIRSLYATGFFTNLRIYDEPMGDGVKVVVIVQPKQTVKEVIIKGAKHISDKAIKKKISGKVGETLNEQKASADAQTIRDYYQDKGFKDAKVEYKIDVDEKAGHSKVTYTITEGPKQIIRDIVFVNAKAFTQKQLRKVMKTRVENWLYFINKSGKFKDEQFKEDLIKLRDFYFEHGYIDMSVKNVAYEKYGEDSLRIKITVFEGIPYQVGKLSFKGNTLFTEDQIRKRMKMLEGKVYSPQGLEADIKAIRDLYGEKGYIETEVGPERQPNIESGKMDLVYQIKESAQFFLEKIVIQGNNRTKDKVIRRELALIPGDVYDTIRAEASKRRLENLGYFSKVDVTDRDTSVPSRKNMVVTVEEKRTGSVTFGVGFSTVDSVLGFVELQQGNFDIMNFPTFTGAGQKFRTRVQYGLKRKDFVVSLTEPWFLNQKLALGGDLFFNESNYLSDVYDQRRYGGAIRLSRALNQFWTIGLKYQLENIEIFNVDSTASTLIKEEEGGRSKSSVLGSLTYDTRDSVFLSRHGEKIEFTAEAAGGPLLGQTKIWKLGAEAQKYFLLPYDLIFAINGVTGIEGTHSGGERVPIFDRYFVGGSRSVRGFSYRAIGPRDNTNEPIGGRTMGYGNLELTYPIMSRVRGAVFLDAGFNNSGVLDYSLADYEAGTGFGLRLDLPIGPLKLDLGFPIVYQPYNDATIKFHFDVGYQF
ncbi:MAG: outer membrane protein assembly factor BamA [bacterium]